jgi:hypothetical protein
MTTDPATSDKANAETSTASLEPTPAFGWTYYAERINGRFAMVGFVALLVLELVTGQTFLAWLGLD